MMYAAALPGMHIESVIKAAHQTALKLRYNMAVCKVNPEEVQHVKVHVVPARSLNTTPHVLSYNYPSPRITVKLK